MSTISASTTSTTGFKVTSDTTGTLVFQTGASPTTAMSISSSQIISFTNPPTATGAGSVATNTAFGTSALSSGSQSGSQNSAFGSSALAANTSGSYNDAFGYNSLIANTTGAQNTAFGRTSLTANTTGSYNVGIGLGALGGNTTANYNTAVGNAAMNYNTTGASNVAVGASALQSNTTASNNTAVGYQAGYTNSTGAYNTFMGYQAGYYTTGTLNSFYGNGSGANATGSYNSFFGEQSGYAITSGAKNTIIGRYNGNQGGLDIRTTSKNIVLSDGDGFPFFGTDATYLGPFLNSIGTYTQLSFTNTMVQKASIWWDNSLLRFQTYTGTTNGPYIAQNGTSWTNSSDERLKNITGEIQNGLAKVCTLRAAEYTWKSDQEAKPQVGLIAQDVLAVLPEAVTVPEEGATEKDGSPAMMGVQYNEVIPLLVAAIKELKAEIDTLKGQA